MKKLLFVIFCFCNLFFSCEEELNLINTCPELIQNVNLVDFPMDSYAIND